MSNIYIQEPQTHGKVLLRTSVGDIDIELWSSETPIACRNFVQLCLEGYYDNNIFHRLVKGFIVQTGDPTGTGMGGESIYGQQFKDEFHSRLRFVRRGLVAMANSGVKHDNGSQFFITLDSCPELQKKHTIFGKVTGNTIYNMIKLGESEVDQNERPLFPHKIISTEILLNPFPDIIPRNLNKKIETKVEKPKVKGSKNFNLLSFGDEAEEEEEKEILATKEFRGKSKSSHDLLKDDPKLSSMPAVDENELNNSSEDNNSNDMVIDNVENKSERLDKIKEKLKKSKSLPAFSAVNDEEDIYEDDSDRKLKANQQKLSEVKNEFKQLKKQMLCELKKKCENPVKSKVHENPAVAEFIEEAKKYKEASSLLPKKGVSREELCLNLLEKFRTRLLNTRVRKESESENEKEKERDDKDDWLSHEMHCQKDEELIKAKDANMRNEEDWYDIYDPRNPINKRRREDGLVTNKKKR